MAPKLERASDPDEATSKTDSETSNLDGVVLAAESKVRNLPQADLMAFDATGQAAWAIPFGFDDYLELVDWTGRAVHPGKRGQIPASHPKILARMGIDGERFIEHADRLLKAFGTAVGAPESLVSLCARRQTKYLRGINTARKVFVPKLAA